MNLLNKKRLKNNSMKALIHPMLNYKNNENKCEDYMNNEQFSYLSSFKSSDSVEENSRIPIQDIQISKFNENYNYYNNLDLMSLHKTIQEFTYIHHKDNENNFCLIDDHFENLLSNFLNKYYLDSEKIDTIHLNACVKCNILEKQKKIKEENTMINSLIKEIESLEELLKETKAEILYNNTINHS
jgi:hypothetical protein